MATTTLPRSMPVCAWTPFIPHKPHAKQLAGIILNDALEVFWGGAAGGGKSDWLLMLCLQYVDIPYYSSIILRKSLTDLKQASALLNRAHEWLDPWAPMVKYIPSEHTFVFPSQARLAFGYLGEFRSDEKYQSAEYQTICVDEALQHFPEDIQFLFSRLRRTQCGSHAGHVTDGEPDPLPDDRNCSLCQRYAPLRRVPLRMRFAGNPGGFSHLWFRERFKIEKNAEGKWVGNDPERPFIQALVTDNPHLNIVEYRKSLENLDPVRRNQLLNGEWDASEDAIFKQHWMRYYTRHGDYFDVERISGQLSRWHLQQLRIFTVIDPAASTREGIAGKTFFKDRSPSWTPIGTFGVTPEGDLLILDIDRFQSDAPELTKRAKLAVKKWHPDFVLCEAIGPGLPIAQFLASMGLPIRPLKHVPGKVENSTTAQVRMEQGRVFLPREMNQQSVALIPGFEWVKLFVNELFIWTGHPRQTDDQIDILSNAARCVTSLAGEDQFDSLLSGQGGAESRVPQVTMPLSASDAGASYSLPGSTRPF